MRRVLWRVSRQHATPRCGRVGLRIRALGDGAARGAGRPGARDGRRARQGRLRAQRLHRLPYDPGCVAGRHRAQPHARRQPHDHRERTVPQRLRAPGSLDRRRAVSETRVAHDAHAAAAHRCRRRGAGRLSPELAMKSWLTTTDHKRIGLLYFFTAFAFFLIGGIEALVIRAQLAQPSGHLVTAETYNQLFTMHGTTMVFLALMPLSASFFNYIVPLQVGARDVAFPRLNAFSYWVFLLGGLFLNLSFFTGGNIFKGELGAPGTGWYGYAPLTLTRFSPDNGVDFWMLGLQILGIASIAGGLNFIVTILNMRAPGMTLFRMPVFVWMSLVTSFLIVFALPILGVALWELTFDRIFDANFFNAAQGGTPLLWHHMIWLFGHPEVYILILPAMGIVSEVLPTISRKPLFGYPFVVFSGIAIGFVSWAVWAHHMFTTGLGAAANSAVGIS